MEKSWDELMGELNESMAGHQRALNELEQVMIARGFITRESLEAARSEAANG